jgi:hypothetical protein
MVESVDLPVKGTQGVQTSRVSVGIGNDDLKSNIQVLWNTPR